MNKEVEQGLTLFENYVKEDPNFYDLQKRDAFEHSNVYLWFIYFKTLGNCPREEDIEVLNRFYQICKNYNLPKFIYMCQGNSFAITSKGLKYLKINIAFIKHYHEILSYASLKKHESELSVKEYKLLMRAKEWMRPLLDLDEYTLVCKLSKYGPDEILLISQIVEFYIRTVRMVRVQKWDKCQSWEYQNKLEREVFETKKTEGMLKILKHTYLRENIIPLDNTDQKETEDFTLLKKYCKE